jgi:hypothetical protein
VVEKYKKEQPVIDSERQLPGKVVDEDVRGALEGSQNMTAEQLLLIDAIMTLPETSLDKEMQRRMTVINAVTAYAWLTSRERENDACDKATWIVNCQDYIPD